MGIFQMMVY